MKEAIDFVNGIVWSPALIGLCLGAGLFYSIATRFVQVRHFKEMIRLILDGKSSGKGISSFQALALSLSGRVGTGNIAGVGAAIGFGGPGAIFWMWIVAFLGAATAYIESTLGQIYKEDIDGSYRGGPAYYIEKLLGNKWYAMAFSIATILACGLLLPTVQSNSIGNAVAVAYGEGSAISTFIGELSSTKVLIGVVVSALLSFIIFGGLKRIAQFTELVVPFMASAYILLAVAIIIMNISKLPEVISLILSDAFSPQAGVGAAIGWGVKRGIYSNEAGQGSGPHAASAAEVEHPAQQGLVQAFSVYVDTLFICSATAFIILITQSYNVHGVGEEFIIQNVDKALDANSAAFTQVAVDSFINGFGKYFVAFALFFFAFTTLLSYYFVAEVNVAYITRKIKIPGAQFLLKVVTIIAVFFGSIKTANLAWGLGDIGVGLMAWLNIIAILIIFFKGRPALLALKDYEKQKSEGKSSFQFKPKQLGIKNAKFWE